MALVTPLLSGFPTVRLYLLIAENFVPLRTDFKIFSAPTAESKAHRLIPLPSPVGLRWTIPLKGQ